MRILPAPGAGQADSPPATSLAGDGMTVAELSCYTAALARYLECWHPDPLARIARSVRLAVRPDPASGPTAFSHHRISLADLDGQCSLGYRGTSGPAELPSLLDCEMADGAGVLAVTYTAAMSWSAASPAENAPHFVLISGHHGGRWQVEDPFSAQLPSGYQASFAGWISTRELVAAMRPPARLGPEHRLRKQHVFGFSTPLPPDDEFQWLARTSSAPPTAMPPGWITDPVEALAYLGDFWCSLPEHLDRLRHLDDMWASARHHAFRCGHLIRHQPLDESARAALAAARHAWTDLPMALRFAAESAVRGRSRSSLVRGLFDWLRDVEGDIADVLAARGYGDASGFGETGPAGPDGKERLRQ